MKALPALRRGGRVIWITGLAGSGKTTTARMLTERLRRLGAAAVLLDGDQLRRTLAADLGYGLADRRRCAARYACLAHLLARRGYHVVVATISMFEDIRQWNRRHVPGYVEVYLRVRAPARPASGSGPHVGCDLPFEEPRSPDLVFESKALRVEEIVRSIASRFMAGSHAVG